MYILRVHIPCGYKKGKPHKYGVKVFQLCEASNDIHNTEVYAGTRDTAFSAVGWTTSANKSMIPTMYSEHSLTTCGHTVDVIPDKR